MELTRASVAAGYAEMMSRYALPLFYTQTFATRAHPETCTKALRYYVNCWNRELHGNNWRRRGVDGCQFIAGIERQGNGNPHSHTVLGHPDLDLASPHYAILRRNMREMATQEWGWAKLEVAKSRADCNGYVAKYVTKDGHIELSSNLESMATGQLALVAMTVGAPW